MSNDERIKKIEEAILLLKDLIVRHEGRLDSHNGKLDDYYRAMKESRKDFDFRMNALIDAQISNEAEITELKESSRELKESSIELRNASRSQLKRIEKLENK